MKTIKEKDHARDQAKAQLESITEMVKALEAAEPRDGHDADEKAYEQAEQTIQDDALEVAVRDDWYNPGDLDTQRMVEYKILLCTGGPAVRIEGNLENSEPVSAQIFYQDWGTPWTEYRLTSEEEETVLTYCRCFYFGE